MKWLTFKQEKPGLNQINLENKTKTYQRKPSIEVFSFQTECKSKISNHTCAIWFH